MENVMPIISEGINSLHSEKNTEDSSHQALTNFSFSEFFYLRFSSTKLKFYQVNRFFELII